MELEDTLFWINHAGFYIKGKNATIFIDPFNVSEDVKEKADLIMITHAHPDHNSGADIAKIRKPTTKFIASHKCLDAKNYNEAILSSPGFKTKMHDIEIEAIASYNLRDDRRQFHPKSERWVGYIITVNGMRIYHAGDTDMIPEMNQLKEIDVALLPCGGKYTMALDEMVDAAKAINPKKVVPMHYKALLGKDGSSKLETEIKSKLSNAIVMEEVQDPIYSF